MLTNFQDLFSRLDLDAVAEVLRSHKLPEIEYDMMAAKVMVMAETYMIPDLRDAVFVESELEFTNESHGFIDLVIAKRDGSCGIYDWKTTGSIDTSNFLDLQRNSWQTTLYLGLASDWLKQQYGLDVQFMEYRCIDDDNKLKSIRIPYSPEQRVDALLQLDSVQKMYNALSPFDMWPRSKPYTCYKGARGSGATCPHFITCVAKPTNPVTGPDIAVWQRYVVNPPKSKSSVGSFLECPERFRREKLLQVPGHKSIEAALGNAFHDCMQVLYKQAFALLSEEG